MVAIILQDCLADLQELSGACKQHLCAKDIKGLPVVTKDAADLQRAFQKVTVVAGCTVNVMK